MADPVIRIKRSAVEGKIPTPDQLPVGEIALNTFDGKLFASKNVGIGTTIVAINPWTVGTGTNTYNTYFTNGNVGVGTTNPGSKLTVNGAVQIQQDSGSNNRLIFRGQPESSYRWNVDNYGSNNAFRIFREDDATAANGSVAVSISTTGTVTATAFVGDGSGLTNLPGGGGGGGGSSSQWVTTAVGIHTLSNVGIGTTNPTSRLTVSGDASITGILTADQVYTSNNGNGQNIKIGDDFWIGDVNVADTTRFSGAQDSTRAFVIFGSSDAVALGRTGTGPLYYGGDFNVAGVITASSFSGNASSATYATTAGVSTNVSGGLANVTSLYASGISTFAGNIFLGDNTADNITVSGEFISNLVPDVTNTYDLGSATQKWRDVFIAGSINKVTITQPASGSTLTIADGKTLTASNTLTFTGTDTSSVAFGGGGTVAYTSNKLSVFAATSSSELAGVISDETGSGALVFATSPTLVTPILGTPTSGTLTNCTGLPISSGVSGLAANVATFLATPSSANLASALTDETGSGALVFATSPTIAAPTVTGSITCANINSSGIITATDFNSSSDLNLKTNIESITSPLSKLSEINGVTFDWIENEKPSAGVIAQDVEKVLPQLVSQIGDYKSVNYNGLIGLLVECIKDQQKQIDELRARLE